MNDFPTKRSLLALAALVAAATAGCGRHKATQPPPVIVDAGGQVDGPGVDAPPAPSQWPSATIHDRFAELCPPTLPLAQSWPVAAGERYLGEGLACRVALPGAKVIREVSISLMQQGSDGTWHSLSPRGDEHAKGYVDRLDLRYTQPGQSAPQDCDHLGADLAEFGRPMMTLSDRETAQLAATIQGLITSRFAGSFARIPLRDGRVLVAAQVTTYHGETYCSAGFASGGPELEFGHDDGIVEVPMAAVGAPSVDAAPPAQP